MSSVAFSSTVRPAPALPGWLPAAALIVGSAVLSPVLGSAIRPLFIIGCAVVGWWSWKREAGAHLQSAILLFSFAALLRRLVDLASGYEPSGLMLTGPLLTILVPFALAIFSADDDNRRAPNQTANSQIWPIGLVGLCIIYATALALAQGDWINAASGALKWFAPLAYGYVLSRNSDPEKLIEAAASVFLWVLPLMGIYGIIQYVDPPEWDRYWMNLTTILAIGAPVPFGVRTFSTMNGPASFATFTAAGLLLVFFVKAGRYALFLAAPAAMSLLLSTYRTAWISLAVGIAFSALFRTTRSRALSMTAAILIAILAAAFLTPFGDMIGVRLASFGQGSDDSSAHERLEEFIQVWQLPDSGLLGTGFTVTDVGSAGSMAMDGMIINCWVSMGIIFGLACLTGFIWAAWSAIQTAWRDGRPAFIVIGALAAGSLVQLPLANIASGELGFLFWMFVVLIPRHGRDLGIVNR
ncbi:MAG: O-antigen ligase domain-containing protein [Beijerinckiaceae bacterium]|nr:O-antigen ligase domain-containing protein [Beijerinckiaceae bacterium]